MRTHKWNVSMIEIMITRKNRLEPTLILQTVKIWLIVTEIKKKNTFFQFLKSMHS